MYHSVKLDMCMHGRKLTTCKFNFSPSLPNASSFPVTPAPKPSQTISDQLSSAQSVCIFSYWTYRGLRQGTLLSGAFFTWI